MWNWLKRVVRGAFSFVCRKTKKIAKIIKGLVPVVALAGLPYKGKVIAALEFALKAVNVADKSAEDAYQLIVAARNELAEYHKKIKDSDIAHEVFERILELNDLIIKIRERL